MKVLDSEDESLDGMPSLKPRTNFSNAKEERAGTFSEEVHMGYIELVGRDLDKHGGLLRDTNPVVVVMGPQLPPPVQVKAAPRLWDDIGCLAHFFAQKTPPKVWVRGLDSNGGRCWSVAYGFGDAAKYGFGRAFGRPNEDICHEHGIWTCDITEEQHSNYKEIHNLVEAVENWVIIEGEGCRNTVMFLFTDNTVAERGYFKGNSWNRSLFNLVYTAYE